PQCPTAPLAARAGRWSVRHRKTAILGWLAFVIVAFAIGNVVGTEAARRRGHRQRLLARRRQGDHRRGLPGPGGRVGSESNAWSSGGDGVRGRRTRPHRATETLAP